MTTGNGIAMRAPLCGLAATFGAAGLLPFITSAVLLWAGPLTLKPLLVTALTAYGACILAYLGGIAWGLVASLNDRQDAYSTGMPMFVIAWSNFPALIGFAALITPPPWSLAILLVGYILTLTADLALARRGIAPNWFPNLRVTLTGCVVICLASALACELR